MAPGINITEASSGSVASKSLSKDESAVRVLDCFILTFGIRGGEASDRLLSLSSQPEGSSTDGEDGNPINSDSVTGHKPISEGFIDQSADNPSSRRSSVDSKTLPRDKLSVAHAQKNGLKRVYRKLIRKLSTNKSERVLKSVLKKCRDEANNKLTHNLARGLNHGYVVCVL